MFPVVVSLKGEMTRSSLTDIAIVSFPRPNYSEQKRSPKQDLLIVLTDH
jgi:hypothetical protein